MAEINHVPVYVHPLARKTTRTKTPSKPRGMPGQVKRALPHWFGYLRTFAPACFASPRSKRCFQDKPNRHAVTLVDAFFHRSHADIMVQYLPSVSTVECAPAEGDIGIATTHDGSVCGKRAEYCFSFSGPASWVKGGRDRRYRNRAATIKRPMSVPKPRVYFVKEEGIDGAIAIRFSEEAWTMLHTTDDKVSHLILGAVCNLNLNVPMILPVVTNI